MTHFIYIPKLQKLFLRILTSLFFRFNTKFIWTYFLILFLLGNNAYAQFLNKKDSLLKIVEHEIPSGFSCVEWFDTEITRGSEECREIREQTFVFFEEKDYLFNIKSLDGKAEGIIITIFDWNNDRTKSQVATSYTSHNFNEELYFKTSKTGVYRVTITFHNSNRKYGVIILSEKRK